MKHLPINPSLLINNETFTFKNVPTMYNGFTDVIYKGNRIAIINGFKSALQWTAPNGSNIPNGVIDELETMVFNLITETNKQS